jgi:tartrate-resistant acid phosphatase type 5
MTAATWTFLVMGDWGGQPFWPYTTGAERATAVGMGAVAASSDATFSLALGDNFYDSGVQNLMDKRFNHTFEDVFDASALSSDAGFTFHVLAGNHDHRGNVSAQVAYSGVSERWDFPSLYYTFTEKDVQFVMIDTVILSGNSQQDTTVEGDAVQATELAGDALPGPADAALAQSQLEWIEATLKASTAPHVIVAGHYPVYSICEHGPTSLLVSDLKPLLEKYNVSAYLNGHDHCAEHIEVDGMQYHTIGSAHENDGSTAHKSSVPASDVKFHVGTSSVNGGFASVEVDPAAGTLTVVHRDGDGRVLYTAPPIARREQQQQQQQQQRDLY